MIEMCANGGDFSVKEEQIFMMKNDLDDQLSRMDKDLIKKVDGEIHFTGASLLTSFMRKFKDW